MKILITALALLSTSAFAQLTNQELERRMDILSDEITALKANQLNITKNESVYGLSPSASKAYLTPKGLSIGGYGEIFYNHQSAENQDGESTNSDPTVEAYRYVLYVGYKFSDKWILNTEIEIEHVNEVFNEFMYLDYLHDKELNFRFGLMLVPVGFINEQHEPTLYPSVRRPQVERLIIPSTWREIGAGTFGTIGKLEYKFFLLNGGNADDIKSANFRGVRKKGGSGSDDDNVNASTAAAIVRTDYNISTQTSIGVSVYKGEASSVNTENLETTLYELHAEYRFEAFKARFLFAELNYNNIDDWNDNNQAAQEELPSKLQGGYLEIMYNLLQNKQHESLEPFLRYERLNLNADFNDSDYTYNGALDSYSYRAGIAYKPLPRITFKADYAIIKNKAETAANEFNLGMGFNF